MNRAAFTWPRFTGKRADNVRVPMPDNVGTDAGRMPYANPTHATPCSGGLHE